MAPFCHVQDDELVSIYSVLQGLEVLREPNIGKHFALPYEYEAS